MFVKRAVIETFGFQDVGRDFPDTCTVLAAVNQGHFQPRSQGSLLLKGRGRHWKLRESCWEQGCVISPRKNAIAVVILQRVLARMSQWRKPVIILRTGEGSTSFYMCEKTKKEIKLSQCVFS